MLLDSMALTTSLHSPWSHRHMVTLHCWSHFLLFLSASHSAGHGTGGGDRGPGDGGGGGGGLGGGGWRGWGGWGGGGGGE